MHRSDQRTSRVSGVNYKSKICRQSRHARIASFISVSTFVCDRCQYECDTTSVHEASGARSAPELARRTARIALSPIQVEDPMISQIRLMPRRALACTIVACGTFSAPCEVSLALAPHPVSPMAAQESSQQLSSARRIAAEIGLDAAALAAAGIDAAGCNAIVQQLASAPASLAALESAKAAMLASTEALENARQAAHDGSVEAAATISGREVEVQANSSTLAGLRTALRNKALETMPLSTVATLNAIDAGRKRRVPTEFTAVVRSEAAWEQLERAVRREARCQRTGEPLEAEYATLLANTRAEPAVAAAAASIAALLPSVEAALVAE
jgi:hypothetical protein